MTNVFKDNATPFYNPNSDVFRKPETYYKQKIEPSLLVQKRLYDSYDFNETQRDGSKLVNITNAPFQPYFGNNVKMTGVDNLKTLKYQMYIQSRANELRNICQQIQTFQPNIKPIIPNTVFGH
jgi:hypothetical protein